MGTVSDVSIRESIGIANDSLDNEAIELLDLFYLSQALLQRKEKKELEVTIITRYANEVDGKETDLFPHYTAMVGFGRVLNQEHSKWTCKCIDVDSVITSDEILSELDTLDTDYLVAYRNNKRYTQGLQTLMR